MVNLSSAQRHALQEMAEDHPYGRWSWGSSHTNRTGSALEAKGLADYEYDRTKSYTWGRWFLTDAGRALLASFPKARIRAALASATDAEGV